MSAEDAEEYTASLGQIMSGGWRLIAVAQRLGVPDALGLTTEAWVQRIGGYVRLGIEERGDAVLELTDPEGEFRLSNRRAADVLGVDEGTVRNDRKRAEVSASQPDLLEGASEDDAETSAPEECADGWTDEEWEAAPMEYLGSCSKGCYGRRVMTKGHEAVFGVRGVYVCSGCGYAYPPFESAEDIPAGLGEDDVLSGPTAGDVADEIAAALDDSDAYEQIEQERRVRSLWQFRLSWLRFVSEHPPGALVEGLRSDDLAEVIRDCDRLVAWLTRAREVAATARRPRRVGT